MIEIINCINTAALRIEVLIIVDLFVFDRKYFRISYSYNTITYLFSFVISHDLCEAMKGEKTMVRKQMTEEYSFGKSF